MSELAHMWRSQLSERDQVDGAGPAWLKALRASGAETFAAHGLPHRKVEDWKYTSLKLLEARSQKLAEADGLPLEMSWPEPLAGDACPVVRLANGRAGSLPSGTNDVEIDVLADVLRDDPAAAWARNMVESLEIGGAARAFAALNTSMLGPGLAVRVPAGCDAGTLMLQWAFGADAPAQLFNSRVLIRLEAGASMTLLEQFQTAAEHKHALNLVMQVHLEEGAVLRHLRLQQEPETAALIERTECDVGRDSHYSLTTLDLGGGLVRHDTLVELAEPGAQADVNGVFVIGGTGHVDHHVLVDHATGPSRSGQFFRGVLGGRSRGVFNGKAKIRPGADGSSVRQSNANLLLSPLAEIDTKPELEIYADEVEASHGATVGQLDEDAVFYLRARGIDEEQARGMLTGAFCKAVLERSEDIPESIQSGIGGRVENALGKISAHNDTRQSRQTSLQNMP